MILLLILLVTTERKKESRAHKLQHGTFQESLAVEGILSLVHYDIQQIKEQWYCKAKKKNNNNKMRKEK